MKRIKLTQDKWALVDDEDFEALSKFKWCAVKMANGFYAKRHYYTAPRPNRGGVIVPMSNEIMKPPKGFIVDHIDGDALNNQRSNLRICTQADNVMNKSANKNNSSGLKGVSKHKQGWQAQIRENGRQHYLGKFATKEEAAIAYDRAAKKFHGEFARTNGFG